MRRSLSLLSSPAASLHRVVPRSVIPPVACGDFIVPATSVIHHAKPLVSSSPSSPSPSWHVRVATPSISSIEPIDNAAAMVELDSMYQNGLKYWHASATTASALDANRDEAQYWFGCAAIRGHAEAAYMLHVECALTTILQDHEPSYDGDIPLRAASWQGIPSVMMTHLEAKEIRAHAGDIASLSAVHAAWRRLSMVHAHRARVAAMTARSIDEAQYISLGVAAKAKVVHWFHQQVDRTDLHV